FPFTLSLYTFCCTASLCYTRLCGYDFPLLVLDDLTVEHNGLLGPDVFRGGPDAEGEGSRLRDEPHAGVVEGEPGRMHGKSDPARPPGREREASKTEQHTV